MENLVFEKGIAFYSQEFSDAMRIETLRINITPSDVENIRDAMKIIKANDFITSINIPLNGHAEYLDDEGVETDEWRIDYDKLIVYSDCVYYYAQNKWHSGDQIESSDITTDELGITFE
jgi:hypothetical protein